MVSPEPWGCMDVGSRTWLGFYEPQDRGVTVGSLLGRAMGCQYAFRHAEVTGRAAVSATLCPESSGAEWASRANL